MNRWCAEKSSAAFRTNNYGALKGCSPRPTLHPRQMPASNHVDRSSRRQRSRRFGALAPNAVRPRATKSAGLFGRPKDVLSDFNRIGTGFLEVCCPELRHLPLLGDPQRTAIFGPPSTDAGSLHVCVLERRNQFVFSQLTDKPIDRGRKKFSARKVIRILDQVRA